MEGTIWFRRFKKELNKMSCHLRLIRIKHGFYRIYWNQGYLGEVFKEMPQIGYNHNENDRRFEEKSFYETKEDRAELTRKIKNFVEGYWETLDRIRTRVYMMKHDKEFFENSIQGYKQVKIK